MAQDAEVIAELALDIADTDEKVIVQLFAAERFIETNSWACRFQIGSPISKSLTVHGVSSLQAVALALKGISATLYSTDLYRTGQLGVYGEFGGDLTIPAPNLFLDIAPYPF